MATAETGATSGGGGWASAGERGHQLPSCHRGHHAAGGCAEDGGPSKAWRPPSAAAMACTVVMGHSTSRGVMVALPWSSRRCRRRWQTQHTGVGRGQRRSRGSRARRARSAARGHPGTGIRYRGLVPKCNHRHHSAHHVVRAPDERRGRDHASTSGRWRPARDTHGKSASGADASGVHVSSPGPLPRQRLPVPVRGRAQDDGCLTWFARYHGRAWRPRRRSGSCWPSWRTSRRARLAVAACGSRSGGWRRRERGVGIARQGSP